MEHRTSRRLRLAVAVGLVCGCSNVDPSSESTAGDTTASTEAGTGEDPSSPTSTATTEASSGDTSSTPTDGGADTGSTGDGGTGADASGCVTPAGLELQDQDYDDSQLPWERTGTSKVIINFETQNLTPEYLGHMAEATDAWNQSPCLETRLVATCAPGSNCVTVSLPPTCGGDGNFDSDESGGFTFGGHIDLCTRPLDALGDGAKQNVTAHEMGHAIGLRHRLTEQVLMNGDTYVDVFYPDEIDFQNLLVLYGNQD